MTRAQERAATAVAALVLQLLFILLFAHFLTPSVRKEGERETLLWLRPSRQPEPLPSPQPQPPAVLPMPSPQLTNRQFVPPSVLPHAGINGVKPDAPSPLEAIGRALYGCTPEQMGKLSPQDRAKCPPLAERPKPDRDLVEQPRSHAKDEALWAEEKAERDWMPNCFGAANVTKCQIQQSIQEHDRAKAARIRIDEERRRRAQPPPMPKWFGPPPRQ
ncbi:MAG TPA: hypothetical protein VJS85_02855 [Rhizomicrobium sp.]|nr:hypothetical protein [Rhizomicrobium sp.]